MVRHGLKPEKFINIQNGVVEEEWSGSEKIPALHEEFFNEHKGEFIVGYFGGHALSNALDKALDLAKDMNFDLVLSGHNHGGQVRIFGRGLVSSGGKLFPKYH